MKKVLYRFKALALRIAHRPAALIALIAILAVLIILQVTFVSQLLAAEVLFGVVFMVLVALIAIFYSLGVAAERGISWAEIGVRIATRLTRRGCKAVVEISRRQFRHPHSQSAR